MIIKFNAMGKKTNKTSLSDAERDVLTLRSTGNAGNEVKPFTFGLGFLCLHRRPMIDSVCLVWRSFPLLFAVLGGC